MNASRPRGRRRVAATNGTLASGASHGGRHGMGPARLTAGEKRSERGARCVDLAVPGPTTCAAGQPTGGRSRGKTRLGPGGRRPMTQRRTPEPKPTSRRPTPQGTIWRGPSRALAGARGRSHVRGCGGRTVRHGVEAGRIRSLESPFIMRALAIAARAAQDERPPCGRAQSREPCQPRARRPPARSTSIRESAARASNDGAHDGAESAVTKAQLAPRRMDRGHRSYGARGNLHSRRPAAPDG